ADGAGTGGLASRCVPAATTHDAGRARRLGRRVPALRRGHRPVLPRSPSRLGTVVRARGRRAPRVGPGDRSPLPLAPHAVASPWHGAVRAQAPRAPPGALIVRDG